MANFLRVRRAALGADRNDSEVTCNACPAAFRRLASHKDRCNRRSYGSQNHSRSIDSKLSLDRRLHARESGSMIAQPYEHYIERRDPTQNMARYYIISGDVQLTRRWGRIGSRGQAMSHTFARETDTVRLFLDLLRKKRRRGYNPRGRAAELLSPRRLTGGL
jgi:predicted DNA-binding WGR domain protein